MKRFEHFDHTADIGVRVYGKTLKDLFKNSAFALGGVITDLKKVGANEEKSISLKACDYEELLINFLGEILNLYNIEEFLTKEILIKKINEFGIVALVKGETFDKAKHILNAEVKGITYHNFKIEKKKETYFAEIIFDV